MLLALDIGNTNVKIGLFNGDELISSWRASTMASRTADEYGMILYDLLKTRGLEFSDIEGIIMSSVAPMLNYTIEHCCTFYLGKKPIVVDCDIKSGIKIMYTNPNELGADRLVSATAAYHIYGGANIIVDFGSATTFNAINTDGEFLGGVIAPGIKTAAESLVNTAAKLPRIELTPPERVLGVNTIENMQSGMTYGFAGLVDYIVKKIKCEKGMDKARVVATGGLSEIVVASDASIIDVVDRSLSLKGLKILYDLNKENK